MAATPAPATTATFAAAAKAVAHAAAELDDIRGFGRIHVYPHPDNGTIIVEAIDGHRLARAVFVGDLDEPFNICPQAAAKGDLLPLDDDDDLFYEWPDTDAIVVGLVNEGLRATVSRTELTRAIMLATDRSTVVAEAEAVAARAKAARDEVTAARRRAVETARASEVKGAIADARRLYDDAHRRAQGDYDDALTAVRHAQKKTVKVTIDTADATVGQAAVVIDGIEAGNRARVLAEVDGEEGAVEFGMDPVYLLDAMRAAAPGRGGSVVISAIKALTPVAVSRPTTPARDGITFVGVIMPYRLD